MHAHSVRHLLIEQKVKCVCVCVLSGVNIRTYVRTLSVNICMCAYCAVVAVLAIRAY